MVRRAVVIAFYTYKCDRDGTEWDEIRLMQHRDVPVGCPTCSKEDKVHRVLTTPALIKVN